MFTAADARKEESRYGCAYVVSSDGNSLLPARYIGPNRAATISITAGNAFSWPILNWRIVDGNGHTIIHGGGQVPPKCVKSSVRSALRTFRTQGCVVRVRPVVA